MLRLFDMVHIFKKEDEKMELRQRKVFWKQELDKSMDTTQKRASLTPKNF